MRTRIIKILITVFFLSLIGCENVGLVETKLEFKEKVVVRAELIPDSIFAGVSFTKTLPVNETYDISKAELKDVDGYLRINNAQIVPLHYEKDGVYKPKYSLVFEEGSTVELLATVNEKSIYSKTIIPHKPSIMEVSRGNNFIQASVSTRPEEAYGAAWVIYSSSFNNEIDIAKDFQTVSAASEFDPSGTIVVRTADIPENYLASSFYGQIYIQVYSFDKSYIEYFKSKGNNQLVNNVFVQSGEAIAWNVYGEDVIGLFIGMAKSNMVRIN